MHFLNLVASSLLLAVTTLAAQADSSDSGALQQLEQLAQVAATNQKALLANGTGSCTSQNIRVRKEWGNLTAAERIAYTHAVLCLQKLPPITPSSLVPGARSRFDDFVSTHINRTLEIHYTGIFLAWHRYFTWAYESALCNECGYSGTQPYWNWGLFSSNSTGSPVFDGSATSMSGNGAPTTNCRSKRSALHDYTKIQSRSSTGGGCVTSGPFQNMSVNLGPVNTSFAVGAVYNNSGLTYNPRCLKRDINSTINQDYANANLIVDLITQNQDIWDFQMTMQGFPGAEAWGVHRGGHYTFGGDPGGSPFASPGDPAFYLHHSMVDRVWWIWQNTDPKERTNAISGTSTFENVPPSANTTLDTIIDVGYTGPDAITMSELMSTIQGPFCYMYD